jgi:tetratricopeptide (TPR) repeat protein
MEVLNMANEIFLKKVFLLFLFLTTTTFMACNLSEEQVSKIMNQSGKDYLSRNTLIHASISEPKGWKLGPENTQQIISDFPFVMSKWDFAVFSHPSSRSSIFVSYKPILGKSYFSGGPKNVAEWFKEAHLKIYKTYKEKWIEVVDGLVDLYTREIGGKPFYVIKNEIFNNLLKEKRVVYIFLHIPEDVKSLYMFCFSTPAKKGIEESQPFQDFLEMVHGYKTKQLEPYDEVLYRISAKLWMANFEYNFYMDAKLHKAIVDESIEELKKAATLRPNAWEPHYLLIEEYTKGSFLGYTVMVVEGKPKVLTNVWPYSPQPINADAAIEECKYLINLNPDFRNPSKWMFGFGQEEKGPELKSLYSTIGRMLNELKKYDEAITYLEESVKRLPSDSLLAGELEACYRQRAKTKAQKEDYDGAIQDYKILMSARGYSHDDRVQYADYWVLAGFYIKRGMKKEALEAYSKALEIVKKGKSFSRLERENTINGLETKIKELQKQ